ncbi:hypothetical protein ATO11_06835 [Pseudaestuariivita atlantica]|uniref:Egg lysin n=2 Tax=Pseudaestuariivita atlantica TaxID=1317121 RepID=A0A0L1JSQ1_9RHOB|nr:DUF3422 domain-containing protein [Pseudaestuariivita atlantica]KNG94413.1 hypothetical protein ATO11_06835 [Pseudaestuariivita atlantica]
MPIADLSNRYALANELHARPFPKLDAPCRAAFLAIKPEHGAPARDKQKDLDHLIALLDRHGAPHPQPGATHYFGQIGKHHLKWESHTEFVTYTLFGDGVADTPFDAATFGLFSEDWLAEAPGVRVTSALIRIEVEEDETTITRKLEDWFVPESLAVSRILDDSAVIAGDFRIDPAGHMRLAVFAARDTGAQRTGRIVQRLCEIETYKTMSMLGLAKVRAIGPKLGALEAQLTDLVTGMAEDERTTDAHESTLKSLLAVSADLESLVAQTSFRFGATGAYEAIVDQRIEVLREERFTGRQTFREFMMRRFDPAMRTVKSTEARMHQLSTRAERAGNLLRTRVEVERSAQNQSLLESMNRRADLQLRLQRTVEGLSIVAISYYAVSLAGYLLYPLGEATGLSKGWVTAFAAPPIVFLVWLMIRRLRRELVPD